MGLEKQRHLSKVTQLVTAHAPLGIQGCLTPKMAWGSRFQR